MPIRRSLRKESRLVIAATVFTAAMALISSCGGPTEPIQSTRVEVAPDTASLDVGQQMTLQATVIGSNGKALRVPVYWSTQDSGVATVSSDGVVSGQAAGRVQVAASSNGVNGSATITVVALTVVTMTIAPDTVSVQVGATSNLQVTLYAATGQQLRGIPVLWGTSDGSIATVSQSGGVTGVATGTATIMAAAEGQSTTATVTVTSHKHHHD
jgi:trimeric autotransporter adhesin